MKTTNRQAGSLTLYLTLILLVCLSTSAVADTDTFTLDNGMTVILKEAHGSPMISSVIFVKSGARYESQFENGITHFLEHLLFDGTVHQTREELDASIGNLGGYINAFTRKDLTAYLVLLPKQYIDYGLTVQADMLFCSLIPEEELPKERKVVIEEINQGADRSGAAAEAFFIEKAYGETDYGRPVLGYKPFIENIPREAIIAYWKQYYTPDRMTALVIGDFETDSMKQVVAEVFGQFEPSMPFDTAWWPTLADTVIDSVEAEAWQLSGQTLYDTTADVQSIYIDFSFHAPAHTDSAYVPFTLIANYLGLDEISPLKRALLSGDDPLATEVGVTLETKSGFSRLDVSVITNKPDRAEEIISTVVGQLSATSSHVASPEALEGIKTTLKCDDIYYSEKLHYYGFIIAPYMMTAGWEFIQSYPDLIEPLTWVDCREAAAPYLDDPQYVATIVRPVVDSMAERFVPGGLTTEEVVSHFDTAAFPEYDLTAVPELVFPATDSISFELVDSAAYYREVLANGLTVIVKSSPSSEVFAINVLGKNRTANEPADKAGITDFVNRCLEKGTLSRTADELSRDLATIGANLTLYDNPWIPYDDRYTSRSFSFIKFETIDEFALRGWGLFTDMLLNPAFDSTEVENVRSSMLAMIGRDAASPSKVSRGLFYETLFERKSYARPITGTLETIGAITAEDLRQHHQSFYSPENMIIAIGTSRDTAEIMGWIRNTLGRLSNTGFESAEGEISDPVIVPKTAHYDLEKEQVSIRLGSGVPGSSSPDAVPLRVATSILSSRLYLTLREKQGLAYSTGASLQMDKDFGWYYSSISTGSENYRQALDGLVLQIDKLKLDGPTQAEIDRARNSLWGRLMSAKLSRINQAYYLALDEFLGEGLGSDQRFLHALQDVNIEALRRVTSLYFRTDTYVLTTAGKLPE
jgi:zinc protease